MESLEGETDCFDIEQFFGHITTATIWFGDLYMPWHDPKVPGGKWASN